MSITYGYNGYIHEYEYHMNFSYDENAVYNLRKSLNKEILKVLSSNGSLININGRITLDNFFLYLKLVDKIDDEYFVYFVLLIWDYSLQNLESQNAMFLNVVYNFIFNKNV